MKKNLEEEIRQIIAKELTALNRPDMFRPPIVAYSSAKDDRYPKLKELIGPWHLNPSELLPDAESIISYFVPFTEKVVLEPKTVTDGAPLWEEAYVVINNHFVRINEVVTGYLEDSGYSAYAIRPTHTYDPKDLKSMWSHRSAAAIAGIGAFGANRLLITEKGSGGRFCTILTSAPLKADKEPVENKCLYKENGSCGLCFKICPPKALTAESMDRFACQDELFKNGDKSKKSADESAPDTCGKCISVCPFSYIE